MSRIAASLLLLTVFTVDAAALVLYEPTPISSSARISDYGETTQAGFRSFDNFTVAFDANLERATWRGFWLDFDNPVPEPAPSPDVLTWDLAFFASDGAQPGALLWSQSFAAADVTSTFAGTGMFATGSTYNVAFYDYSIALPSPFALSSGTEYWFSVLARSDVYNPAFALRGATGGDDSSFQHQLGAQMSIVFATPVARDRAILLEGTLRTVPEPATSWLAAAAMLLLAFARASRARARPGARALRRDR